MPFLLCLLLIFLTSNAFGSKSCSNEYKERFCRLNPRNRKLEGIRLAINNEADKRCQPMESERAVCFRYLASLPIFASDIKLMALLTAHRDFKLRSFYAFEYIMSPISFHNALDQIFYRERTALLSVEFAMEIIVESVRVMRNDYENFLMLDSQNANRNYQHLFMFLNVLSSLISKVPTHWQGTIREDTNVFGAQMNRTTLAENELNEAYTTFIELYNALDEREFISVPVGVRSKVQRLMSIHKDGYRDLLLIIQSIQVWMANATKIFNSMAKDCELSDVRSYRENECTIRHMVVSRILEVIENYAENFDQVCDKYLKSYYLTSPLSLIRYIDEDQMDDLQTETEAKYSSVSKLLQRQFDKQLQQQKLRSSKRFADMMCHKQLINNKNIVQICNKQPFKRLIKH